MIGIDPGKHGGLAVLSNSQIIQAIPMPLNSDALIDWIKVGDFMRKQFADKIIIENVHSHPRQGVVSVFSFGLAYGGLLGVCGVIGIEPPLITPQRWYGCLFGKGAHGKQETIHWVQQQYPGVNLLATPRSRKPHDGMADAIAIAHVGSMLP